jgi:hypothetical protein
MHINLFAALFDGLAHPIKIVRLYYSGKAQQLPAGDAVRDGNGERAREFQDPPLQFIRQGSELFYYLIHHRCAHFVLPPTDLT